MKITSDQILAWGLLAAGTAAGVYVLSQYKIDVDVKPRKSSLERDVDAARIEVARKQGQLEARLDALREKAGRAADSAVTRVQEELAAAQLGE